MLKQKSAYKLYINKYTLPYDFNIKIDIIIMFTETFILK